MTSEFFQPSDQNSNRKYQMALEVLLEKTAEL